MSSEFELNSVDRFVVGTIGMPGDRTFYFQSVVGRQVLSFKCEKAQVSALVDALDRLISELPSPDPSPPAFVALDLPLMDEWPVGVIGLAYDAEADMVMLVLEEMQRAPDQPATGKAQFKLTRAQIAGLAIHGGNLVASGRPICQSCGAPVDPEGYNCACNN
jgi:uncharacterized repeat protein (TIGR03847 family)